MKRFAASLLFTLALSCAADAADDVPLADRHALKMATKKVVIFKDGYGLFLKEGLGTTSQANECYRRSSR